MEPRDGFENRPWSHLRQKFRLNVHFQDEDFDLQASTTAVKSPSPECQLHSIEDDEEPLVIIAPQATRASGLARGRQWCSKEKVRVDEKDDEVKVQQYALGLYPGRDSCEGPSLCGDAPKKMVTSSCIEPYDTVFALRFPTLLYCNEAENGCFRAYLRRAPYNLDIMTVRKLCGNKIAFKLTGRPLLHDCFGLRTRPRAAQRLQLHHQCATMLPHY